jgi:hypothetical protein
MQVIRFVVYETSDAIFIFEIADAISHLKPYAEQGVSDAIELMETISATVSSTPIVKVTADYFGFIVLDLIKAEKGEAYCKTCKKIYDPGQLRSIPLGFGRTPFSIDIKFKQEGGFIKRLFGRKSLICGEGGTAYECPKGHELISAITWTGTLRIPDRKPHWPL